MLNVGLQQRFVLLIYGGRCEENQILLSVDGFVLGAS